MGVRRGVEFSPSYDNLVGVEYAPFEPVEPVVASCESVRERGMDPEAA